MAWVWLMFFSIKSTSEEAKSRNLQKGRSFLCFVSIKSTSEEAKRNKPRWENDAFSNVSIKSTSEEAKSVLTVYVLSSTFHLFPLNQLPKKLKALAGLKNTRISLLVSIKSTSEEAKRFSYIKSKRKLIWFPLNQLPKKLKDC